MEISKAAAQRILETKLNGKIAIVEVRELPHVVLVRYRYNRHNCCTFVSKREFTEDFLNFRLAQSYAPHTKWQISDSLHRISFQASPDIHTVDSQRGTCTCHDFQKQVGKRLRPICKHLLAVAGG